MNTLLSKLNFKEETKIIVLNAPVEFSGTLKDFSKYAELGIEIIEKDRIQFLLCFIKSQAEINDFVTHVIPVIEGDPIIWLCYPKQSSKRYKCDFNRDKGWGAFASTCFEPVRQVAIDEDWSALRFRNVNFIKKITRRESFAITKEAKSRTTQKGK